MARVPLALHKHREQSTLPVMPAKVDVFCAVPKLARSCPLLALQTVLMTLVGTVCIVGGFVTLASQTDDAAKDAAGDDLRMDGLLAIDGDNVLDVEEKLGLLSANSDFEVAGGAQECSAGNEGILRESWARSVMGKLGRGKSNRSSSDSNVEFRHFT